MYDNYRGIDQLKHPTVTKEDILAFCEGDGLMFCYLGSPDEPDNENVFRVGTNEFPSRGATIKLDTVAEWKIAVAAIGEEVTSGGVYREYTGEIYTTFAEAKEYQSDVTVVIFRNKFGELFTLPRKEFFRVISIPKTHEIKPRFAFIGIATDMRDKKK